MKMPKPIPIAMVVCDMVVDDRRTGKKSLIGIFTNINSRKIPVIHPRLNVFLSLTEGNGEYEGILRCINVDDDKSIFQMQGPIMFKSPHSIIEFNFEILGLLLPKFGNYRFEFLCNNELLISRKFQLLEIKEQEGGKNVS